MITAWTKHCKTEEEKAQYIESLRRVKWALDHAKELISASVTSIEAQEISPKSYDSPNWEYRQAHANGYKQAVADHKKLLTIDKE